MPRPLCAVRSPKDGGACACSNRRWTGRSASGTRWPASCTTIVQLQVRRFYCRNPSCPRRTFAEPLPDLVRPYARRTSRLSQAQSRVGVALGGEGGARLLAHLSMPASAATVLRLVEAPPATTPAAPCRSRGAATSGSPIDLVGEPR